MEESVKERIIKFVKLNKTTVASFERKCGLSNGYVRNLKNAPSSAMLKRILGQYSNLSRVWLLTGEGEMLNDSKSDETEIAQISAQDESVSQQNTIDRLLNTIDRQMALLEAMAATNDRYSRVLEHIEMSKHNKDEQPDSYLHRRQDVG